MSRFTAFGGIAIVMALAVACDDKKVDSAATDAAATTAASGSAAAQAQAAKVAAGDEPSEEDFEEEAERSITAANLESEIAKMEAELK